MQRKVLKNEAREMILKVKEFCEMEKKNKELLIPLRNVQMRVAAMTGVSVKTVMRISKEGEVAASTSKRIVAPGKSQKHPKKNNLDDVVISAIRQKIHFFVTVKNELPTINKLRLELKEDINYQRSNTTLRRLLKKIGYQFQRGSNKKNNGLIDVEMGRLINSTESNSTTVSHFQSGIKPLQEEHNYSK